MSIRNPIFQWFTPEQSLRFALRSWFSYRQPRTRAALLALLRQFVNDCIRHERITEVCDLWVNTALMNGLYDPHWSVQWQAIHLIAPLLCHDDYVAAGLLCLPDALENVLSLEERFPMPPSAPDHVIHRLVRGLHLWSLAFEPTDQLIVDVKSDVTDILTPLLAHPNPYQRQAAAKVFGCIAPTIFFNAIIRHFTQAQVQQKINDPTRPCPQDAYAQGIELALIAFDTLWYGEGDDEDSNFYDPGMLEVFIIQPHGDLAPAKAVDDLRHYYLEFYQLCSALAPFYFNHPCSQALLQGLQRLFDFVNDYRREVGLEAPPYDLPLPRMSELWPFPDQLWLSSVKH